MVLDLYNGKEPGVNSSLKNLSAILDPTYGLISGIKRVRQYYDEPKFWHYSATVNGKYSRHDGKNFDTKSSGVSFFSEETALLKCLGEAIERYCNFVFFRNSTSFIGSLKGLEEEAVNPCLISCFSEGQLQSMKFKRFRVTEDSKFRWTKCKSLITNNFVHVPSQLIYLSYPFLKNEPNIYPRISTGVAGGGCLSAALVRGIYEIVERDSFMIHYLNKLEPPKIDLKVISNDKVRKFLESAKRYKLEIVSLDVTSDLGVPVVVSIIINRIGIGKAISVGLKSNFNIVDAIIGSIEEALHTRSWLRNEYEKNHKEVKPSDLQKDSSIKLRGFLWYPFEAVRNLNFWIQSSKRKIIPSHYQTLSSGEQLKKLVKIFKKSGCDIYYKDLMTPSLRKLQYHVVKVIVPQMQPLYLNEKYPLLGGERLYSVPKRLGYTGKMESELNKYPHPFL